MRLFFEPKLIQTVGRSFPNVANAPHSPSALREQKKKHENGRVSLYRIKSYELI